MNGLKHGWLSGFEAGQVSGIKKVFIESFLININLFEKIKMARRETSVLEQINISDLRRESLTQYHATFARTRSDKSRRLEFKRVTSKFKGLTLYEKLKSKKMTKRPLDAAINGIYEAYFQ